MRALDGVSIAVRAREILCLAGENGSGKSTWIKILAGALAPDSGEVVVGGVSRPRLTAREAIDAGIRVIYQDLSLFSNLTVAENIALPALARERRVLFSSRRAEEIAGEALGRIGAPIDPRSVLGDLPLGSRQLVAIARALQHEARAIVLDEPTSALTAREADVLFRVLRGLRAEGVAIVFVSHRLGEILEVSDRIAILRNGRKVAEGPAADFDRAAIAAHMTGRAEGGPSPEPLAEPRARQAAASRVEEAPAKPPLLRVERLTRTGRFSDVSFEVFAGEVLGLAGLLGSGRTALALALFGLEPPEAGTVQIDGRPLWIAGPPEALAAGIAYVPEDRLREGLFLDQSVERNIAAGILDRLSGALGTLAPRRISEEASRWIGALGIRAPSAKAPVAELSGGNQQKAVLAKGLAASARILILDRPTAGVDVGARAEIHAKVQDLAREGRAVIAISDETSELAELADRILVFHRGRPVREIAGGAGSEEILAACLKELR